MRRTILEKIGQIKKRIRRKSAAVIALGLVITMSVFYLLSLPALTLEKDKVSEDNATLITQEEDEILGEGAVSPQESETETAVTTEESGAETSETESGEPTSGEDVILNETEESEKPTIMPLAAGASSNLSDFVSQIVLKDSDGTVINNGGTVTPGQDYTFNITFKEDPSKLQFEYNSEGKLVYQLPPELSITQAINGKIMSSKDPLKELGSFVIDTDGKITVVFDEVDEYGNPTPGTNFIDNFTNATFTLEVKAQFNQSGGEKDVEIDFGNGNEITVVIDEKTKLQVKKAHGGYDKETHKIEYTVDITAVGGDVKELVLHDLMKKNGLLNNDFELVGMVVSGAGFSTPWELLPSELPAYTNGEYTLNFPSGYVLGKGEKVTVKYILKVKDEVFEDIDLLKVSGTNKVVVTGKDKDNEEVTGEGESVLREVEDRVIGKTGRIIEENGVKMISWSIALGDGYYDLSGKTLTEVLGPGLTVYRGKTLAIKKTKADGSQSSDVYLWDNAKITMSPGDTGFEYTFGPTEGQYIDSEGNTRFYTFDLVFYTNYDPQFVENNTAKNTVWVELEGENETDASVNIGTGEASLVKDGVLGSDGSNEYIEYTITTVVPSNLKGLNYVHIKDQLNIVSFEDESTVFPVENIPIDPPVVTAEYLDGTAISPFEYQYIKYNGTGSWANKSEWHLYMPKYGTHAWQYTEDVKVTVKYKISLDAKTLDGRFTLRDLLQNGVYNGKIVNLAQLKRATDVKAEDEDIKAPIVAKQGIYNAETGYYDYLVHLNYNRNEALAVNGKLPIFKDDYDPMLEYVNGSFEIILYDRSDNVVATFGDPPIIMNIDETNSRFSADFSSIGASAFDNPDIRYEIKYSMKERAGAQPGEDNIEGGKIVLKNKAVITIYGEDGQPIDYESDAKVDYHNVVDKKMVAADGNTSATVEIVINADAIDLNPGGDTIKVIDKMSDNLVFYLATVKVEKSSDNGATWQVLNASDYTLNPKGPSELELTLPDNTHLRLTYKVRVMAKDGETIDVKNAVKVEGWGTFEDVVEDTWTVQTASGTGGGSKQSVTIYKEDKGENTRLEGAEFAIYGYKFSGWSNAQATSDGVAPTITSGSDTYYYYGKKTTGTDGTITFGGSSATGVWNYLVDTDISDNYYVYALVEIKAPDGYQKLEEPIWFSFGQSDDEKVIAIADMMTVYNETGKLLPQTGGNGKVNYLLTGALLMILSSVWLYRNRKKTVS